MTPTTAAEPLTRADALLRLIIADPANDDLRLIYAEDREDSGDYARAEFIRVQCDLAKYAGRDQRFYSAWPMKAERLRKRERELLERHGYKWCPELPDACWRIDGIQRTPVGSGRVFGATFVRGWPVVSAPLAVLLGGQECPDCNGSGCDLMPCVSCNNKGKLPGILAALAALVPLDRVTAVGAEPADRMGVNERWYWFRHEGGPELADHLPSAVFALLPGATADTIGLPYPTRAAALAALSAALIRHGRGLVPWLNPPVPCGRCKKIRDAAKRVAKPVADVMERMPEFCFDCGGAGIAPAALTPTGGRT